MVLMPPRCFTSYPGLAVGEPGTLFGHVWTWKFTESTQGFFGALYRFFKLGFVWGDCPVFFLDSIGAFRARIPIL